MDRANTQVRTLVFEIEGRASDDAIPVVVSTDVVAQMPDGPEILVHTADAIDLKRAPLPIIATHRSGQLNVGLVDNLTINNGQLRGIARFGSRAEAAEYKADVLNRTIRSVSVGYARIKGYFRRSDEVLVVTRWMPTHAALVAEPVDIHAGFFRSLESVPAFEVGAEPLVAVTEVESASRAAALPPQPAATAARKEQQMENEAKAAAEAAEAAKKEREKDEQERAVREARAKNDAKSAGELEGSRVRAIENLCKMNRLDDRYRNMWVNQGLSLEEVSEDILKILEERGKSNPQPASRLGLTAQETQRFSLQRAIAAISTPTPDWKDAGFELECSRSVAKRVGKTMEPTKFFVPFEVMERPLDQQVRQYLEALGARLELVAVFDEEDQRVPINLGKDAAS